MNSKLIVMLTHNDKTIHNSMGIFESCSDLPVEYWGFKNVGISESEMDELVTTLKQAGKKTMLEVVTYSEESCMLAAKFACKHNFDYLLGTCFFDSVWDYIKTKPIQYFPFVGTVYDHPSILTGSINDMIKETNNFYKNNICGVDVLAYRYRDGEPISLAKSIVEQTESNVIVAGSINSIERLKEVYSINPWGFTIGSALYTEEFLKGAGYRENLKKVLEVINSIDKTNKDTLC